MTLEDSFISGFIKTGLAAAPSPGKPSLPSSPGTAATPAPAPAPVNAMPKPSLTPGVPLPPSLNPPAAPKPNIPFYSPNYKPSINPMPNGPTIADAQNLPPSQSPEGQGWKLVGQTGDKFSMSKMYRDQQGIIHHVTDGAQDYDQLQSAAHPQPKFSDSDEVASFNRVSSAPRKPGQLNNDKDPYASSVIEHPSSAMYSGQPVPNIPLPEMEHNFEVNSILPQNEKELQQLDPDSFHTSSDPGIRENEIRELRHLFNQMAETNPEMARSMNERYFGSPKQSGPSF